MLSLESVYPPTHAKVQFLYDLLADRPAIANISHVAMPSFDDHNRFVLGCPYRVWYLICEPPAHFLGAIYATDRWEIGVQTMQNAVRGAGSWALQHFMDLHGPRKYYTNYNPTNEAGLKFWTKNGFKPLQNSLVCDRSGGEELPPAHMWLKRARHDG